MGSFGAYVNQTEWAADLYETAEKLGYRVVATSADRIELRRGFDRITIDFDSPERYGDVPQYDASMLRELLVAR